MIAIIITNTEGDQMVGQPHTYKIFDPEGNHFATVVADNDWTEDPDWHVFGVGEDDVEVLRIKDDRFQIIEGSKDY